MASEEDTSQNVVGVNQTASKDFFSRKIFV